MAFTVPEFPLLANVFTGPYLARVFRLQPVCNLAFGRRTQQFDVGGDPQGSGLSALYGLLVPALTDIRDLSVGGANDVIECPAGSGCWYGVWGVGDVGKGFPNEYRFVYMTKIYAGLNVVEYAGLVWPTPIP